jgi:hypothetical protein
VVPKHNPDEREVDTCFPVPATWVVIPFAYWQEDEGTCGAFGLFPKASALG